MVKGRFSQRCGCSGGGEGIEACQLREERGALRDEVVKEKGEKVDLQ